MDDLRGTFTEEQMKKETERCLGCGAVVLDEYRCVGCGICTTKCKFDAIKLVWVDEFVSPKVEKIAPHLIAGMAKRGGKIAIKALKDKVDKLLMAKNLPAACCPAILHFCLLLFLGY